MFEIVGLAEWEDDKGREISLKSCKDELCKKVVPPLLLFICPSFPDKSLDQSVSLLFPFLGVDLSCR